MMTELELTACAPDRLLSYLAALGVLRLVGGQVDSAARGRWQKNAFLLRSSLDRGALEHFFLHHYRPSPLVMPWNSGAFSSGKENSAAGKALAVLETSRSPRLATFREAIRRTHEVVAAFEAAARANGKAAPKDANDAVRKEALLRYCRNKLPDEIVEWLDAAVVLTGAGDVEYPPLLGSGGNDGRMDFTSNYMQRLADVLPEDVDSGTGRRPDAAIAQSAAWLRAALFSGGDATLLDASVGQFDPGSAGGPNATAGFAAGSVVNPWQFILALEGTLLMGAAAVRRLRAGRSSLASIPFTVRPIAVGYATAAEAEVSRKSRAELWLPLWSRGWTLAETEQVFSEGRLTVGGPAGRRQAAHAVDVARAIAQLGVDRGIDAFLRFSFLQRSGNAYFAVYLGQIGTPQAPRARVGILAEIETWHRALRSAANAASYNVALRRLEAAMFAFTEFPDDMHLETLLRAMGRAEQTTAEYAAGARRKDPAARVPSPLQGLSGRWLPEQGSPETRIALALAGTGEAGRNGIEPLRIHLEPVEQIGQRWDWAAQDKPTVVWGGGDLVRNLCAVLERRTTEALQRQVAPASLNSRYGVRAGDIAAFLANELDDDRIGELLWAFTGLSEGFWARGLSGTTNRIDPGPEVDALPPPNAYTLLKLALLPSAPTWPTDRRSPARSWSIDPRPFEQRLVGLLRAGQVREALVLAGRRLRIAGLPPLATDFLYAGDPARLEAALLIPICAASIRSLEDRVLAPRSDEQQ